MCVKHFLNWFKLIATGWGSTFKGTGFSIFFIYPKHVLELRLPHAHKYVVRLFKLSELKEKLVFLIFQFKQFLLASGDFSFCLCIVNIMIKVFLPFGSLPFPFPVLNFAVIDFVIGVCYQGSFSTGCGTGMRWSQVGSLKSHFLNSAFSQWCKVMIIWLFRWEQNPTSSWMIFPAWKDKCRIIM